jgi:hypothetical protein
MGIHNPPAPATSTKLDDLTAPDDNTDLNASTTKHGLSPKATAPGSGLLNVLSIGNGETVHTDKALFDTTNPAALGSIGPGTALVAARRDHIHPALTTLTLTTPLNVASGGTGVNTLTSGNVLVGAGTSDVTSTANISVAQGGTGVASLTANSLLLGAGTSDVTFAAPSTSGNVLTSNGTVWASAAPAGGDTGLVVEGRLTLTSGTPVTTADVTGATNIYFAPYGGNRIGLYDGSSDWNIRTFTQITIAVGTIDAGKPYDLFCYDNSGTPTFDAPLAWTNDTSRATALTTQDGVLVKSGATTRRYIGTFYTTATTTTEDSYAKRFLWNYYNRVHRPMRVIEATGSWVYTTATLRQANGSTANQLDFVVGVNETMVTSTVEATFANSSSAINGLVSLGLDSTSATTTGTIFNAAASVGGSPANPVAHLDVFPGVGHHIIVWLEYSTASGTCTWYSGSALRLAGIHGWIEG